VDSIAKMHDNYLSAYKKRCWFNVRGAMIGSVTMSPQYKKALSLSAEIDEIHSLISIDNLNGLLDELVFSKFDS
jgi:hypothetical protein